MQEIERNVREYGQRRNIAELQEYVDGIDVDEITLLIKRRIQNAEFPTFWNYLMQGLDTETSHEKRFIIITTCIHEIKDRNLTSPNANMLITRLCMELSKFLPRHLVSLCVLCMGFIQKGDVVDICWRELLPELLNVIIEKPCIEFNLNEMSGSEFKIQFIKSLCVLEWSTNIIIPLIIMFIEMPLSKEEHLQVVYKLVSYVEKLTPQELPTFVYQVLRFCRLQNSRLLFHKLQKYFDLRIYNSLLSSGVSNSEDIISDSADEESIQAESTVLYHIFQSTILGNESIKEYISSLKNLTKSPEFILHPFQLTVLLTISTVQFYEDKVFEIIRQCIARHFHEEAKKVDCCWLRTLVPSTLNLEDLMVKIIHNCNYERDLVVQGLVDLSFVLLSVGALLGRDSIIVKKQWNLGKFILLTLVKEKQDIAHAVLQRLCNIIVTGNNINQYVECFREFSTKFTYVTLENKSCIIELMEALVSVPENCAEIILDIVIPLTKVSPTIRDHLILLLRKALYSRSNETRQVSVRGFLKLLAKQKISNLTALSQINISTSPAGHSVLTQISLHRSGHGSQAQTFSSEALCLDILNILKRCYMQQSDIRSQLYNGLHDAVNQNPDLAVPVLNLLWAQFLKYYNVDENVLPPVDFSNLSFIRDTDVVVQEPIGHLTSAISFLIVKIQELEDEDTNYKKYLDIFESICNRLTQCELIHFELDDGTNLTDILPECKKKVAILREAMSFYECLIGYQIWSWNKSSRRRAEQIVGLFQGYFRLQQCAKNASKTKKIDRKKKDAQQNRPTQRSQSSVQNRPTQGQAQPSSQDQNDQQNISVLKSPKAVPIKLPPTVLSFKVLIKFLNLLHGNVDWTSQQQANLLKVKHDIHQHIMQATISQLQLLTKRKGIERNKEYYIYCKDIAQIIYPKCIERLEEFMEFDITTASLAVECFNIILGIVSVNYGSELKSFLQNVGHHEDDAGDLLTYLSPFVEKYQNLLMMENTATDDQEFKKMLEIILNTLIVLASHFPINSTSVNKFLDWMKAYATDCTLTTRNAAQAFANLWFSTYIKYKSTLSIFEEVINNLYGIYGSLLEENEGSHTLKVINELTVVTFMQCLTNAIKILLENVDWMTNRLRSEHAAMVYNDGEASERRKENLSDRERSVSCQMCLSINLVEAICNVKVPIGLSEYIIKNVSYLYNNLNGLTKYFILRSSKVNPAYQNARFERVVKLAGKRLSPTCNKFILYLEEIQSEEVDSTQAKKKNSTSLKNKILKETKLIPKVVYEIEQFTKSIIQLSNKTKEDLASYIGAGTTRDFRIRDIKNVMEKNKSMDATQSDVESNDRSTIDEVEEENSSDEDSPPSKRSKT